MDLAAIALSWHAFWLLTLYFHEPALHQVHFLVIGQSPDEDEPDLLAALMRFPMPHVVCVAHEVLRCDVAAWYVFAGHAEHVRFAVLESALMRVPLPHMGCVEHTCPRCDVPDWYVFAGHALHVKSESAPEKNRGWVCTLPSQLDPYPLPWLLQPESFALMRHCFRAALYV